MYSMLGLSNSPNNKAEKLPGGNRVQVNHGATPEDDIRACARDEKFRITRKPSLGNVNSNSREPILHD